MKKNHKLPGYEFSRIRFVRVDLEVEAEAEAGAIQSRHSMRVRVDFRPCNVASRPELWFVQIYAELSSYRAVDAV